MVMERKENTRDISREHTDNEGHILLFYNETDKKWTAYGTSAVNLLRLVPRPGKECRNAGNGSISLGTHELEDYGLVGQIRLVSDNCLVLSAACTEHADERSVPTPSA